jgi:hypothetical protein
MFYYKLSDEGLRVFTLDKYVVKRDPQGRILKIIIKEGVSPTTIPEKIKSKNNYR